MKSLEFFSRTYTEPGGSAFHPNNQPLTQVARSRVVYLLYPEDRAVVYSGIDEGVPTNVAAKTIIELILAAEKFDPDGWSFFDLVTNLQGSNGPDEGDVEFHLISWRHGQGSIIIEGSILLDCPSRVAQNFARFIGCPPNTDPNILLSGITVSLSRDHTPPSKAPETRS